MSIKALKFMLLFAWAATMGAILGDIIRISITGVP